MKVWRSLCALIAITGTFSAASAADKVEFELHVLQGGSGRATNVMNIADIDGDGKKDIIGTGNPRVHWYKYPDLTCHTIATSAGVGYEIHAGDIDGDGDMDVATNGGGMTWFENPLPNGNPASGGWKKHGAGSEGTKMNGGSHDFKIGDIDGDGKIDMVERCYGWTYWLVYHQKSPDSWDIFRVNASRDGEGTAIGDVDLDGDLDLSDGWVWVECPGSAKDGTCNIRGNWVQHNVGDPTHRLTRVAIADINEDGRPDIVSSPSEYAGNALMWFEAPENPAGGEWQGHVLVSYNDPNFHSLQIADIDLDGHLDIFVGSTHGPCSKPKLMWIFYNVNGDGSEWEEQQWSSPKGCWQAVVDDVGSDGDMDIVTCDYAQGSQNEFWENKIDKPIVEIDDESFHRRENSHDRMAQIGRTPRGETILTVAGEGAYRAVLVDVAGREVARVNGAGGHAALLPRALARGTYVCTISSGPSTEARTVMLGQ